MRVLDRLVRRVDAYQRSRPWLAFPVAVWRKFSDDGAGRLAALIAYYGFFSLFPLLLVLTTVLGFVLQDDPRLRERILESALAQFPIIGSQISENVRSIRGSGVVLVLGLLAALWAGLGATNAMQHALNKMWDVPDESRPNLLTARLRSLLMLLVLGGALVAAGVFSGLLRASRPGFLGLIGSLLLSFGVFLVAFRLLTTAAISWRDAAPGAAIAAIAWGILQVGGAYYVARVVKNASEIYGFFAVVIGLLSWIALGAQLVLFAAEINVVRVRRLWPRSLTGGSGGARATR